MKLDTKISWVIKCPNCLTENVYETDLVFCNDADLDLSFSCHCPKCQHHFGYIQHYTNDSSKDEYAGVFEMKEYSL